MLGDLIAKAVPWIIPLFLLASWLVNSDAPKISKKGGKGEGGATQSPSSESSRDKENAMTDKDMTSG